ncbi:protein ENHANCED DOWNY MILDEW 2-like isoform X3 [Actinidia eriantha]|uniref:protein ENHANCED DOWNY MILDEW 2-like isoform X3 n=1 Tax=Actinidia eriantha TaxID=165200 RepID=UPI00258D1516|nr:protein ENHANCED DOWNY MILDEW 2-like isoform X3 [Actinidia eriantha]
MHTHCVTNYHLVDYKENPISFSTLPLHWSEDEMPDGSNIQIFLRGSADNGLQQIYKKVIAWKFELSYMLPEVYVLSKDKTWIKLQKPRKSFENTINTILITVHSLHIMKKNPEASSSALWKHLQKAFSSYEIEPSENDLLEHMPLIKEAAVRDKEIAKSEYLSALLLEIPGKREALHEQDNRTKTKFKFMVDAADDDCDADESDESGLFDSVCALCDNGGELLCCQGRCMRSFHATVDAGVDSLCESLGYTEAQVDAIQTFLCKNCQYQQHQCFACGICGPSKKYSQNSTPNHYTVFPCVSATCGHFYHPKCVAKLLYPGNEARAKEVQNKIAAGESFACPAHKCTLCKQGEDKEVYDLQFALCRRCPKAYHRKCLPRGISFEYNADNNIHQRAWDGLLPNRILIYCMKHKIIPELGTPERNHITFPGIDAKKKQHKWESLSGKEEVAEKKRIKVVDNSTIFGSVTERSAVSMKKRVEEEYVAFTCGNSTNKCGQGFSRQGFGEAVTDCTLKSMRVNVSTQAKVCKPSKLDNSKSSLRNDRSPLRMMLYVAKPKKQDFPSTKAKNIIATTTPLQKESNTQPLINAEMEKRIMELMNHSTSSFNVEEFIKKRKRLSGNVCSSKSVVDKTITRGRVKGSVKAVRAALKKLKEGGTIEDAQAVCPPDILKQIVRWKEKLQVYLAPVLLGMRYTSFGRHFTKVDKLKQIVDRLHWYVHDGDMIVDFCCGSNDFSCLLKEKLDQMGKSCSFRNYDLIQSKNDFSFEKRDWMSVCLEELPAGSRLIMGLNPPFGVHAAIANQFIAKALTFKPKLVILIVPRETKRPPYDLIWEDDEILHGKAFYLPGSVDVHDQQLEQWNNETPPLYLWSRPDWTAKHKAVAQRHGHVFKHGHSFKEQEETHTEGRKVETTISNYLMEENHDCYGDLSNLMNGYGDISRILDDVPEDFEHEEETSQMGKLGNEEPLQLEDMCMDMELSTPRNSLGYNTVPERLLECHPNGALGNRAEVNAARQGLQYLQPNFSGPRLEFGTEHSMFHTTVSNGTEYGYRQINKGELLSGAYNSSTGTNYSLK